MPRTWSKIKVPHRELVHTDAYGGHLRGEDVAAAEAATKRRLDARDVDRDISRDGDLSLSDFKSMQTAARLLGVLEETLDERDERERPVITVGALRIIRYPGTRSEQQLQRARERMAALKAERDAGHDDAGGGVSGLSANQRSEARRIAVASMELLLEHEPAVHYTMGGRRWDGIRQDLRYGDGQFPRYADCSSSTTWALWNALTHVAGRNFPDIVNGADWEAGYTGTQLVHGTRVSFGQLMPADLIFYGSGWPGKHVTMYVGDGLCISHGSEAGPFRLSYRYRGDLMEARRYI